MATTAYPHGTVLTANLNFNQPKTNQLSEAGKLQGLLYAAIGTALGLLAGTATAVGPWGTNSALMARDSVHVSLSAPGSGTSVPQSTLLAASIQIAATPAPVLVQPAPVAPPVAVASVHHVASNLFTKRALSHQTMPAAIASTVAPAAVETVETSVPATPDSASSPASMTIEGDLTVADFDASTGTLETREGRSFTVTPVGNGGSSLDWQDYAGNVHYQCTQAGSCSLTGSGMASNATVI
jgi:hypothetical protein